MCGTIGFLQGFSSFLFKRLVFLLLTINRPTVVELSSNNCRMIIRHMSDDNKTVIGRLIVSKAGITFCCFRNYCLGMIGIIYSKGGCKEINKIIYIIVWFIFKCIIALFLTIGLSFLTYKYIELPGKKFIRSLHIPYRGE